MNKLQKSEYELLKCAIDICEKYNLRYYLVCGSALGAVKYNGFIPWDDDVDIALPRPDYNIFCEKAIYELPNGIFLQNAITDKYYYLVSSKLRDLRTTFIEKNLNKCDIVHGVFIDVFALDSFPNEFLQQKRYIRKMRHFSRRFSIVALRTQFLNRFIGIRTGFLFLFSKLFGLYKDSTQNYIKYNNFLTNSFSNDDKIWCNHHEESGISQYHRRSTYGDGLIVNFESLSVVVPSNFDDYLSRRYGDWRADLPEDQKVGHHYAEVIDLNRPYTDYIVKLGKGKIRLKTSEELKRDGINPPEGYRY